MLYRILGEPDDYILDSHCDACAKLGGIRCEIDNEWIEADGELLTELGSKRAHQMHAACAAPKSNPSPCKTGPCDARAASALDTPCN